MSDDPQEPLKYDGPERRNLGQEIDASGPGGFRVIWRNPSSAAVLLVVLAGGFGGIAYYGESQAIARQTEVLQHIDMAAKAAAASVEAQRLANIQNIESQKSVLYLLSLSQSERERFPLTKPDFLRAQER